ncbi:tRNA (adenosine(37)-N6)-threonylcarbamoyltransferase complex dimerization subunit type 1 TsaB [Candidatus Vesicomyidisocius sp. SY067_SCS001]|uniref:tRNA (adenosine(37)-N6)-threonylcarbamoyltransferase complex dimerization subunit type 1 TsaB n=1 Tax=Candidatus Vesicomyidisocius sp. SY067_SCS001 TaxID=2732590 RepID=UPI0016882240|nr:tRNA (adenosine(37)-N6)-threonylcarbamoyltransferase complex dimerization subunit type 1 TsaB [Candidatus Vesicomyosocius sp. SY067_SCS001]
MINLLAIDTCTNTCSVSLYTQGEIFSRFVQDVNKSSGLILSLCDEIFKAGQLLPSALDGIIYTKGPGSFTGVRMCVSVVQGISLAYNIPTVGFSTLELLGFGAFKKYNISKIAIALDARMNEVYWGIYQNQILCKESLQKPDEVDILGKYFIGVGDGWGVYDNELIQQTGINTCFANFYPKAENLIVLYLTCANQHINFSNKLALPTYLRNNVAHKSLK